MVVKDMHEPIITEEQYELAQKAVHDPDRKGWKSVTYPLKTLMVCGNCGRRLARAPRTIGGACYKCRYGLYEKGSLCAGIKSPKELDIEDSVYKAIGRFIEMADTNARNKKMKLAKSMFEKKAAKHSEKSLQERIDKLDRQKLNLYEQYCSGSFSKEDFLLEKAKVNKQIEDLEDEIQSIKATVQDMQNIKAGVSSEAEAVCEIYRNEEHLTYEMAHAFVDRIVVHSDSSIEIVWKFKDIFLGADDKGKPQNG